jgi:hypothetical protein
MGLPVPGGRSDLMMGGSTFQVGFWRKRLHERRGDRYKEDAFFWGTLWTRKGIPSPSGYTIFFLAPDLFALP